MKCPACSSDNLDDSKFCRLCATPLPLSTAASEYFTHTLALPVWDIKTGNVIAEKYQIIDVIGRGGMGVVYVAQDIRLKRTVALKFLPPELTQVSEARERFTQEARAASALDHNNICTVYEIGETDKGQVFISMAYYGGASLKDRIAKGPLDMDESVNIALQLAEGLQRAHEKGIIHRDIKPANILFTQEGVPKLLDFGLAKLGGEVRLTKVGTTMGTIAYMSPEQAKGEEADQRSDIYSFGVVLYEMLGGQLPFKGEHEQAIVYSLLHAQPRPLTELVAEIPISIEQVVAKALEKNPDDRYQTMQELLDDLRSISAGTVPEKIKERLRKARLIKRKKAIIFACTACVLVILTVLALKLFTGRTETINAIAVLPLENLTGDQEQEYFVDGATDELIGQLAQIGALRVISRRSVMQYKGVQKSLPEIARELNVDAVVEGAVHQVGDNVRIRVQLTEAFPEERNLWSQTYDRSMTDVLMMYKEMARAIADKTQIKLTVQEEAILASTRQVNPEAYEAYTKGMFNLYKLTPQDLDNALQYFEFALEKDPNYALAYVGIGQVWGGRQQQGLVSAGEAGPKSRAARQKALELDDTLPEVHYALAGQKTWGDWEWESAEKEFRRAIELNPNYPDPRAYYSQFLFMMNRPEDAMAQIERALELDPFNAAFRSIYAWDLMYARRYDEAVEHLRETLKTAPTDQMTLSALKSAYHLKGMHEEALEIWKTWFDVKGDSDAAEALMSGFAEAGYSGALSRVAEVLIERSLTTYVTPWQIATLYTRAMKIDEALEWLEKAYEAHDANMPYIAVDPIFDSLRDDPRFQDLLRRMNFPKD